QWCSQKWICGWQIQIVSGARLVHRCHRGAEAVRCETGSRAQVVEAGRRGTVVDRRTEGGHAAVAEVEGLSRVEEEDPVKIDLVFQRQNAQTQECRDQPRSRRRFENLHEASGVVAVGMGQIDPPQVSWLYLGPQRLKEIRPGGGQAAIDEQRLLSLH